jgi:hypothetical protein
MSSWASNEELNFEQKKVTILNTGRFGRGFAPMA